MPVVLTEAGLRQAIIRDSAAACGWLVTGGYHRGISPGRSPGTNQRGKSPRKITGANHLGEIIESDHRGEIT